MAVDSLMEAANQLQKAHHAFADKLMGRTDVPEHHSVDQFFQTVKAAADVQVCIRWLVTRLVVVSSVSQDRTANTSACISSGPCAGLHPAHQSADSPVHQVGLHQH